MATTQVQHEPRDEPRRTPWWRRLLLAQESGLVLVIGLLMTMLTIFGGSKDVRERIAVPEGVAIVNEAGPEVRATIDGTERTFDTRKGWELDVRPSGQRFFVRESSASKFLNLENLMSVLVFASYIAIMAVGITAVIVMGGIDLSIGSTYALAALLGGIVIRYHMSDGWPGPTVRGSAALWWGAVVVGVGALLARVVMGRGTKAEAGGAAQAGAGSRAGVRASALRSGLLWAGAGLLIAAGWHLVLSLWRVEGASSAPRSALAWYASVPLAIGVCTLVGGVCGWLNGKMVVGLKVHPFIITLGTMAAYRGLVALPTQAQTIGEFPESLQGFVKWTVGGVTPMPVIIMLLVGLVGAFVLQATVLGRRVFAIGGNETAARYAGIPVDKVKVAVFTLMGALAGVSAFVYLGYFGAAETNAGKGYELNAIAAAVIGGASLSGGRGSILGAILGAVLVGLIENGILMLEIDQNYNQIILGGAIIAAVVLDQLKGRLMTQGR